MFQFGQVNIDVVPLDVLGPLYWKATHLIVHKVCFVPNALLLWHGQPSCYVDA